MFSEFEQRIHEMAEADEPLTADALSAEYGKIMKKYYGPDYTHDELVDSYWIRIPHFYYNFYVYKYSTSYCAASAIAAKVMAGEPGAVEAYMKFLKGGCSKYPVDLLKIAGVDMTTSKPIDGRHEALRKPARPDGATFGGSWQVVASRIDKRITNHCVGLRANTRSPILLDLKIMCRFHE